jgi:hypothetical protein
MQRNSRLTPNHVVDGVGRLSEGDLTDSRIRGLALPGGSRVNNNAQSIAGQRHMRGYEETRAPILACPSHQLGHRDLDMELRLKPASGASNKCCPVRIPGSAGAARRVGPIPGIGGPTVMGEQLQRLLVLMESHRVLARRPIHPAAPIAPLGPFIIVDVDDAEADQTRTRWGEIGETAEGRGWPYPVMRNIDV